MLGEFAFCPKTGAPLSREKHYDETGRPRRAPVPDEHAGQIVEAELTNGAVRSSLRALTTHFRRCHQHRHDADRALYREAALALTRLKQTATGSEERDVCVWYALCEHLAREGHDADWMHAHVEPRCPACHGPLTYERLGANVSAHCATNCTGDDPDRLAELRETVATLYERTFSPEDDVLSASDLVVL